MCVCRGHLSLPSVAPPTPSLGAFFPLILSPPITPSPAATTSFRRLLGFPQQVAAVLFCGLPSSTGAF